MRQNESLFAWWTLNNDVVDVSLNGNNGTPTDVTFTNDRFGQANHAATFNGSTSMIALGNLGISDITNVSYCAWIKLDSSWSTDGQIIGARRGDSNSVNVTTNRYVECRQDDTGLNSVSQIPLNTWTHIIYTFEWTGTHSYQNIYINGVLDASRVYDYKDDFIAANMWLGYESRFLNYFNGDIDDVRIYSKNLSAYEADLVYNGIFGSETHVGGANQFRCVVEHASNLYYPAVINATCNESFPWSAPTANIVIVTNDASGTDTYMSPIREDDPIRLQVAVQTNTYTQATVWQDIFEGRISALASSFSDTNNTVISARGHDEEALYSIVEDDRPFASKTTGAIINELFGYYMQRVSGSTHVDSANSSTLTAYNVKANTKYVADVIREMENLENYNYKFGLKTTYTAAGLLDTVEPVWAPVDTVTEAGFNIREGNQHFVSADFKSSSERKTNNVRVVGDSTFVGTATSGAADRHKVVVDKTLASSAICTSIAQAILARWEVSNVSGSVQLMGDANISTGNLVNVVIPSLIINGAFISDDYLVRRVTHNIGVGGWTTGIEVGEIDISFGDLISHLINTGRLTNANLI